MEERRHNSGQFESAKVLAERIERMTREREENQTLMLEGHSKILGEVKTTLSLLVERTENLPDLVKRVTALERWKAFVAGIAASFTVVGGSIGWLVGWLANGGKR